MDGDVILDAVIGTNGLVQDMTVTHGLPQLIRAATHAVSQWQYQPARINGVAIACKTTIDVHFLLQTDPAAAAALNAANNFAPHTVPPNGVAAVHPMLPPPPDGVLRVSPRAMEALLENDEKPVYPADAISLDARGTVFLLMTVSKSGEVSKVQVLTAAIAALRRRKYKPYEVDGEPREVQTMVSLDFAPTK